MMILFGILIYLLIGYIAMRLIVYIDLDNTRNYFRNNIFDFLLFALIWPATLLLFSIHYAFENKSLMRFVNRFMGIKDE